LKRLSWIEGLSITSSQCWESFTGKKYSRDLHGPHFTNWRPTRISQKWIYSVRKALQQES